MYFTRRPYSFGLGKRAGLEMNEDDDSQENTQSVGYETWQMNMPQQSELTHAFDGEGCGICISKYIFKKQNLNLFLSL